MKIVLTFSSDEAPVLTSVAFQRDGHEPRLLLRGKQIAAQYADGTFQWSRAVRALALLLVGSVVFQHEKSPYVLSGEKGSSAASLDYALSKPTQWILDMFGSMANEKPYALRIFGRRNSEGKQKGPIEVFLQQARHVADIHITDGRQNVYSWEECYRLFQALGGLRTPTGEPQEIHRDGGDSSGVAQLFQDEVVQALSDITTLEPLGIRRCCERVQEYDWCSSEFVDDLHDHLLEAFPETSDRYQFTTSKDIQDLAPCTVAVLPLAIGSLVLVRALQKRGAPIRLEWEYSGTADMLVRTEKSDLPFCCVLSIGALVQAKEECRSLTASMLLPRTSFSLLTSASSETQIYCASGKRGYPYQLYQLLCAEGELGPDVPCAECTLAEAAVIVKKGMGHVIVGFPYSALLKNLPGICEISSATDRGIPGENILCIPDGFDARPLIAALRGTWYELLEDLTLCQELTRELLSDPQYYKYIKRLGGLHALAVL